MSGKAKKAAKMNSPVKTKSAVSRLNARLEKLNNAAKKLEEEKLQVALDLQKSNEVIQAREQKKQVKEQKAALKAQKAEESKRKQWSDDERQDLIAAFKECLELYEDTNNKALGYIPRSIFRKEFFESEVNRARHNLESWDGDQCLRQIDALTDLYKQIFDTCRKTGGGGGGGGLHDTLAKRQMSETLYNAIGGIYEGHPAINMKGMLESGITNEKDSNAEVETYMEATDADATETMDSDVLTADDIFDNDRYSPEPEVYDHASNQDCEGAVVLTNILTTLHI
ncbi:hypothetical protein BJ741DRAFT_170815 [Chytriomyces cf. hyalinus JEL632]|nr:hypothetical protein BJ741DRAFT_170815 [Chytriomyces cf. hyalinus JEL632]